MDLRSNAKFRAGGPHGIEMEQDGVTYDVRQDGADHVVVTAKGSSDVLMRLGMMDGEFVMIEADLGGDVA